jgi:predicted transposase YbfD/YdcC
VSVSHAVSVPVDASVLTDSAELADLVALLGKVADPRKRRGIRHQIATVLAVTVLAVLAGAKNYREAGDRAEDLPQELLVLLRARRSVLSGRRVAPSADTIRRVVESVDAEAADGLVCQWLADRAMALAGADGCEGFDGVAIDGKAVRNSGGVRLFSAMRHGQAVVISQIRVPDETTETTQVTSLLKGVDLAGAVVTADAAHTQRDTARHLVSDKQADYVLAVKGNQPTLLAQVHAVLPPAAPGSEDHVDEERSHGRITRRAIWATVADGVDFPYAAQVFRIRRDVFNLAGQRVHKEIAYGVTSLNTERASARDMGGLVRGQWGIENKIHWVRDVVFAEDHQYAYIGNGAHAMAMLRNLAIGLIRLAGLTEIKRTLEWIAADRMRILPLLAASTP